MAAHLPRQNVADDGWVGVRLRVDIGDDRQARRLDGCRLQRLPQPLDRRLHELCVEGARHCQPDRHASLPYGERRVTIKITKGRDVIIHMPTT